MVNCKWQRVSNVLNSKSNYFIFLNIFLKFSCMKYMINSNQTPPKTTYSMNSTYEIYNKYLYKYQRGGAYDLLSCDGFVSIQEL